MKATLFTAGAIAVIALANSQAFAGQRADVCVSLANLSVAAGTAGERRIPFNAFVERADQSEAVKQLIREVGATQVTGLAMVAYGSGLIGIDPSETASDIFDGCMDEAS